ncbi:class II D-tagatose-bisphosphate aldolase non-catalytic subunit [Escherichia coli]
MAFDRNSTRKVLIEATSNQVNQFGGYTVMTLADFREFVFTIADRVGFARERIILGGDDPAQTAGSKEMRMRRWKICRAGKGICCAGFSKIHLDASMSCAGDPRCQHQKRLRKRAAGVFCFAAEKCGDRLPA